MKIRWTAICALLFALGRPAFAHRLDEYLQLTTISVAKGRVRAKMYLTPGVAVFRRVMPLIDIDGDGKLSEAERRAYADRVLHDLSLTVDGVRLKPRLLAFRFPKIAEMKQGIGEIEIDLDAPVRGGAGSHRLVFENHHQKPIAAYLVECFVPEDPDLRVTGQSRNFEQSRYAMGYVQSAARLKSTSISPSRRSSTLGRVSIAARVSR